MHSVAGVAAAIAQHLVLQQRYAKLITNGEESPRTQHHSDSVP